MDYSNVNIEEKAPSIVEELSARFSDYNQGLKRLYFAWWWLVLASLVLGLIMFWVIVPDSATKWMLGYSLSRDESLVLGIVLLLVFLGLVVSAKSLYKQLPAYPKDQTASVLNLLLLDLLLVGLCLVFFYTETQALVVFFFGSVLTGLLMLVSPFLGSMSYKEARNDQFRGFVLPALHKLLEVVSFSTARSINLKLSEAAIVKGWEQVKWYDLNKINHPFTWYFFDATLSQGISRYDGTERSRDEFRRVRIGFIPLTTEEVAQWKSQPDDSQVRQLRQHIKEAFGEDEIKLTLEDDGIFFRFDRKEDLFPYFSGKDELNPQAIHSMVTELLQALKFTERTKSLLPVPE